MNLVASVLVLNLPYFQKEYYIMRTKDRYSETLQMEIHFQIEFKIFER